MTSFGPCNSQDSSTSVPTVRVLFLEVTECLDMLELKQDKLGSVIFFKFFIPYLVLSWTKVHCHNILVIVKLRTGDLPYETNANGECEVAFTCTVPEQCSLPAHLYSITCWVLQHPSINEFTLRFDFAFYIRTLAVQWNHVFMLWSQQECKHQFLSGFFGVHNRCLIWCKLIYIYIV